VVVCEGDADRAIYQTVAHGDLKENGGEEVLFIHANGKAAIKGPLEMLRKAGTPVCVIVDFDILNSETLLRETYELLSTTALTSEMIALRIKIAELVEKTPEEELLTNLRSSVQDWESASHTDLREARKRLENIAERASKWKAANARGVDYFEKADRKDIQRLIKRCSDVGLFVVSKGELESWMPLGVSKGKNWNRKALEELHEGRCPQDLRGFVEEIVNFLTGPADSATCLG
jgi:OLD-like protein